MVNAQKPGFASGFPYTGTSWKLSKRAGRCSASPLRQIFEAIETKSITSFAGGLPGPETFEELVRVFGHASSNIAPKDTFQYGSSNGERKLREWIARDLAMQGLEVGFEQVIILSGSQQGIDLAAKLTIDEGTRVAVSYPTYLAALQTFDLYGAHYTSLDLLQSEPVGCAEPAVAYVNPTFSNPTGANLNRSEREQLAANCDQKSVLLIEDDPYRELYYQECDRQPICANLQHSPWVFLSSFSKTIAPGLRIGYMAVSRELLPLMVCLKQAADLHTARHSQVSLQNYLESGRYHRRLDHLRRHYREKRDNFQQVLYQYWSDIANWEVPEGGMFFWLTLKEPGNRSMDQLIREAIEQKVAFMPGKPFYPSGAQQQDQRLPDQRLPDQQGTARGLTLRLNFTCTSMDEATAGLIRLRKLFD